MRIKERFIFLKNNILSIESSGGVTGVSLINEGEIIDTLEGLSKNKMLAEWVSDILIKNNTVVGELSGIAIDIGPGGFTSLRAGLSLAKGLALSSSIPIVPVKLFDAVASEAYQYFSDIFYIAMHAYGKNFFMQPFKNGASLSDPIMSSNLEDLDSKQVVGYKLDNQIDCKRNFVPSSITIGQYAFEYFSSLATHDFSDLECLYLGSNF